MQSVRQNKNIAVMYPLPDVACCHRYEWLVAAVVSASRAHAPCFAQSIISVSSRRPSDGLGLIRFHAFNMFREFLHRAQLSCAVDGEVLVKVYDCVEFLRQYYTVLPSISKYHIFTAKHEHANKMFPQENSSAKERVLNIGLWAVHRGDFPAQLYPKGLDLEWQWYLYEAIRPFCSCNLAADITCPKPMQPKPSSNPTPVTVPPSSTPVASVGTKQSQVTCRMCRCQGHTKWTRPMKKSNCFCFPSCHYRFYSELRVHVRVILLCKVKLFDYAQCFWICKLVSWICKLDGNIDSILRSWH